MFVNLLAHHFDCFRDVAKFDGRQVQIMKRAQILVADLWAAFDGESYGRFNDIDELTMFAGLSNLQASDAMALTYNMQTIAYHRCSTRWGV